MLSEAGGWLLLTIGWEPVIAFPVIPDKWWQSHRQLFHLCSGSSVWCTDGMWRWLAAYISTTSANTCGFKHRQTGRLQSVDCSDGAMIEECHTVGDTNCLANHWNPYQPAALKTVLSEAGGGGGGPTLLFGNQRIASIPSHIKQMTSM